jgi:hypothetical protein
MTTTRSIRDAIANAFDFLIETNLVLYVNTIAFDNTHVGWHGSPGIPFMLEYGHATSDQYLRWVAGSHYSALLPDGSLLQLTYRLADGDISGHRLAYVPCPVIISDNLLREGEPVSDIVQTYLETGSTSTVALRSPVRFDFDPATATDGHPAAHMTINGPGCRIACVAPLHPYRFIDFVFRHFYPKFYASQSNWFQGASRKNLGKRVLIDGDTDALHVMWPTYN